MKYRTLAGGTLAAALLMAWLPAAQAQSGFRTPPGGPLSRPVAPAPGNQPRAADYIVAVVNSEPITNNEVRTRLLRFEQQLQQQGQPVPPRNQLVREVVERLISEKAQLQLARELGMKIDDATVDQAEQNVARQNNLDVSELRRRMRADGIDPARYREELRAQLLLQRLRDREMESRAKVSELEIDQYLREQAAAGAAPSEFNLAHILVAVPENASEQQVAAARAKAQRALDRARAGEDFGKVAAELSDAPGAAQTGGVVGYRAADQLPPLFVEAIEKLPAGGVSSLIRSAAGFHVIKVLDKREGGPMNVTQSHVRHILLRPSAQMNEAQARARLAEFKKRIEAGQADFAQLARDNSQDASASKGGDLGWANPGLFVPEFEEVVNSLAPGKIAEPVTSRFGVHLIQLLERRRAKLSTREQREVARNILREKKLDEAYADWAREIRGRAFVELREPPQ